MNKNLLSAIVDVVHFFANCDDETCDPDSCVKMLEVIAHHMQQLTPKQVDAFKMFCNDLARQHDDKNNRAFIKSIPKSMGL